jgi:hypothetical protein
MVKQGEGQTKEFNLRSMFAVSSHIHGAFLVSLWRLSVVARLQNSVHANLRQIVTS